MMKKILGLDIGTNSIGWAITDQNFEKKEGRIIGTGVRIIPMSADILGKFDSGQSVSQTADRTFKRSARKLYQRSNLRRERLHRVLNILDYLPEHYGESIDFEKRLGQFKENGEVKLNYRPDEKGKMHFLFMQAYNEMLSESQARKVNRKLPYDHTIYYLRSKALQKEITKQELAWILLNFNQKRGYYQLRGEEKEEDKSKEVKYYALQVSKVEVADSSNAKFTWYNVHLENGFIYKIKSKETIDDWVGLTKEFIVTTHLETDGTEKLDKEGDVKRTFKKVEVEKDWIAIKTKTEQDILDSRQTVGQYIYENLLADPYQKIRGKLIRTIERKYYKDELSQILCKQAEFHPEFNDPILLEACLNELYRNNEAHRNNIRPKGLHHLLLNDILFYQRPLKKKTSTIGDCQYEFRRYTQDGIEKKKWLKGCPKSHPAFQEFRLWQFIHNLKVIQVETEQNTSFDVNKDVTSLFFPDEDSYSSLFDYLWSKESIDEKSFLKYLVSVKRLNKKDLANYEWNYVQDRSYPCGETRAEFVKRLSKMDVQDAESFFDRATTWAFWHLVYSVDDKNEYLKALATFAKKKGLEPTEFAEHFRRMKPFERSYASYSLKAIKKLLPLMRLGKHWQATEIDSGVKSRIQDIQTRLESIQFNPSKIDENLIDDDIPQQVLKSFVQHQGEIPLKGMNTYQACYAVYDRHSEVSEIKQWTKTEDIDAFLNKFQQHSLNNPIVEQVVMETMRVVRDLWSHYGGDSERYFDEIHVELGREMKNPAAIRQRINESQLANQNTNIRIKELLLELKEDEGLNGAIKPYSPSQQEILKIYEEGVVRSTPMIDAEIEKIRKNNKPTRSEIKKYRLWLEQKYISPYTGQVIPLSELFTRKYEIEHVIPQSRYFDNSMSNKVICESEVNSLKDNDTGLAFIQKWGGQAVELGDNKSVTIFNAEQYVDHCSRYFKEDRNKLSKLLSEDIPTGFINRQLNDSRYISKLIMGLMSNVVREEGEQDSRAKAVVPMVGSITSVMRQQWGLNHVWNALVAPRFQRLNELTGTKEFGDFDPKINAFRTRVPEIIEKGFEKKRIDHRHHALDALAIACTTADHVNYITSLNTARKNHALVSKLRVKKEIERQDPVTGKIIKKAVAAGYHLPWSEFTKEAERSLEEIIVSVKQNLRVINKSSNYYQSYKDEAGKLRLDRNGRPKKAMTKQVKGANWAIRKSMHKATVSGFVIVKQEKKTPIALTKALEAPSLIKDKSIRHAAKQLLKRHKGDMKAIKKELKSTPLEVNGSAVAKVSVYEMVEATATRKTLSSDFTRKQLDKVTDSGIRAILNRHVVNYKDAKGEEDFATAFGPAGLKVMNEQMTTLNGGKPHAPIYAVRIYEEGSKFAVGHSGNNHSKYVEADKGTNLFFAIYWNEEKQKREYETVPLHEVIEHQKQVAHLPKHQRTAIPINPDKGQFLFSLSPNDLVYLPTVEELEQNTKIDARKLSREQKGRIYKMVSCTSNRCHFLPVVVAQIIINEKNQQEFQSLNKIEITDEGLAIKANCVKIEVNRIGIPL